MIRQMYQMLFNLMVINTLYVLLTKELLKKYIIFKHIKKKTKQTNWNRVSIQLRKIKIPLQIKNSTKFDSINLILTLEKST